jgi:orotidine-5'-phosphate decarboxylase
MLKAAVEARDKLSHRPLLIGVTVLTSLAAKDLQEMGVSHGVTEQAFKLAQLAKEAELDGVVASAHEAAVLKEKLGQNFLVITPGIRPAWSVKNDDQKRIVTPKVALNMGSDYLVIGRPIIASDDPFNAAKRILNEMDNA